MKLRLTVLASVAVLAVAVAGCGADTKEPSAKSGKFHVIVLGGLSAEGGLADPATTSVNAAKAGAAYANANGGIGGKQVKLTVIDDQGDPTVAVTKLREELAKGKPDVVMNSGPSTIADATLPILNQNGILSFNIGPTATSWDPSKFPLNFDNTVGASESLRAFGPYLQKQGYKSAAILYSNTAFGASVRDAAEGVLREAGIDLAGEEEYDAASLDMTPQLEALKAKDPDVLILNAYGAPVGYVMKGIAKLGWDVPVVGEPAVSSTSLTGTAPPDGLVGTDEVANLVMEVPKAAKYDPNATATNEAVKLMLAEGPIKSQLGLASNYDAFLMLMHAAEVSGSTDPKDLAAVIEDPKEMANVTNAIFGHYGFTPDRHAAQNVEDEYTFIPPTVLENGQFKVEDGQ